jgi:hypothetical protein
MVDPDEFRGEGVGRRPDFSPLSAASAVGAMMAAEVDSVSLRVVSELDIGSFGAISSESTLNVWPSLEAPVVF